MLSSREAVLILGLASVLQTASASVAVIAPGKIRLGTEQKIFLLGENLNNDERSYVITMWPLYQDSHIFYRHTVTIQNDHLEELMINVSREDIVPETANGVTLRVQSTSPGGLDKSQDIEIDKSPGYLLIQIDKPIYTSRQKVKYRIIAVDESLTFPTWQVQISLRNPKGYMIDRITKPASEAFNGDHFQLSRSPMKGMWSIKANFVNFSTESVATFEVKDYILPRFALSVKCNSTVVLRNDRSTIQLNVKAQYVYGMPLQGRIHARLMARISEVDINISEQEEFQLDRQGSVNIMYDPAAIMDNQIMANSGFPIDLYVAINATEHGTGNVLQKVFKLTTFADNSYQLRIINPKKYFQPGLSYRFELEATRPDGRPARNVPITILVSRQGRRTFNTNNRGRVVREFPTPANAEDLTIRYKPANLNNGWSGRYDIERVMGVEGHRIKVDAPQNPNMDRNLGITIRYTTPPGSYYIMVTSRGQVVYVQSDISGTNGMDVRTIPSRYLHDMVPQARIVVFYMVGDQLVADSTVVQMNKVCSEELKMDVLGDEGSFRPKDTGRIRIDGGPHMRVGLLAVDKGVYALKFEKSLTRKTMFDELLKHDMGIGAGDGLTTVEIFKSAGFTLITEGRMAVAQNPHSANRVSADPSSQSGDSPLLRSFFPESWLFVERTLDGDGVATVNMTFPDSITTWIMYSVGVSPERGICVSKVEKTRVFKDFFVDLYVPFRAVKLEEVEAKITVSNYMTYGTSVRLNVTADGVCVLGCEGNTKEYNFHVAAGQKVTRRVQVLPTRPGDFLISATAITGSRLVRDDVQKQLLVVSEGEPQTKTINFNLDPRGEDRNNPGVRQGVSRNVQTTTVNLTFPKNTVPHSEQIEITASGDLLGDIVNSFVLSKNLPSDSDGPETLLKELVPSCYGLHYLHTLGILAPEVSNKGRQHISHGVSQLLKYKTDQGGFCQEEVDEDIDDNEPTIWFTALALKTLCTAHGQADIQEEIFTNGFTWLLGQIRCSGSRYYPECEINEKDENQRLLDGEKDQLLSEVLLAAINCSKHISNDMTSTLNSAKSSFIQENHSSWKWGSHQGTLTMAKIAHTLIALRNNGWKALAKRLNQVKHEINGYIFWTEQFDGSVDAEEAVAEPTAEDIEATSYALMVFLHAKKTLTCLRRNRCRKYYVDINRIADWLLQWRSIDGLYIAASDTAVATEALAMYRNSKRIGSIDLNVGVSTSPNVTYTHSLEFEQSDAFTSQSLEDVPLGQKLQVETEGTGLGQMHVKTKFNTPVDVNKDCRFDFTVERYRQLISSETDLGSMCGGEIYTPREPLTCTKDATNGRGTGRDPIHCLKVCIKSNGEYNHGKLDIRLRMLSGYVPNQCDLDDQNKIARKVLKATYYDEADKNYVNLQLKGVSNEEMECYGFRIIKVDSVNHLQPATVTLKSYNVNEWACPRQYESGEEVMYRPFYCSVVEDNQYRGCSCINDSCVDCKPPGTPDFRFYKPKLESAIYVFKLRAVRQEEQDNTGSKHLIFLVLQELKNCMDQCFTGTQVVFVTKRECGCPTFVPGTEYWAIGTEYNTYADSSGVTEYRFFLNKDAFLLSAHRSSDIFPRQSDTIRDATDRFGTACPTGNQRQSC